MRAFQSCRRLSRQSAKISKSVSMAVTEGHRAYVRGQAAVPVPSLVRHLDELHNLAITVTVGARLVRGESALDVRFGTFDIAVGRGGPHLCVSHRSIRATFQPIEFLTSYISYARTNIHPKISEEASQALVKAYVSMRALGADVRAADRRITATTRQLESMIRLAEAHAKMRMSSEVTANDVHEAVRLIQSALKQSATDSRTGLIDMGLLTEGTSAAERRRKTDLKDAVLSAVDEMLRSGSASVRVSEVLRRVGETSSVAVESAELAEALRSLEGEGKLLVSGEGARRSVRRVTGIS